MSSYVTFSRKQMEGNVEVELLEEDADNSVDDEDESITDAPGERSPNLEV